MEQKQHIRIILIAVVSILFISGIGYVTYTRVFTHEESSRNQQGSQNTLPAYEEEQYDNQLLTDKIDTSKWQTYRNEEYGFSFKYPTHWKIVELEVGKLYHDPNVLFNVIVETENHPLNRVGNVILINMPMEILRNGLKEGSPPADLSDFSSVNLSGIRFQKIYPKVHQQPQQTDYNYVFDFYNRAIVIRFSSFNTSERKLMLELLEDI